MTWQPDHMTVIETSGATVAELEQIDRAIEKAHDKINARRRQAGQPGVVLLIRGNPLGLNAALAEATALPAAEPPETADRRWSDADRELVASNISDRAPSDAAADILDALAAAGRLADPQELVYDELAAECERLRARVAELEASRDLLAIAGQYNMEQIASLATWITESVPGEPSRSEGAVETAIRVMASLAARVAELEQHLATAMDAIHKCDWCMGLIVWSGGRWQHLGGDEPCCPPGPEVRCVRTDDRRHWARTIGGDLWVHPPGGPIRWEALLALSAVTVCGCIPATPPEPAPHGRVDPDTPEQVYRDALALGLSDYEARETAWPQSPVTPPEPAGGEQDG